MNGWALFKRATRMQVLPVIVLPVVIGGSAAFAWHGAFQGWLFLITLLGASAAHLFSNMINDLWDYRNGADQAAKEAAAAISTNSGVLTGGILSEKAFAGWTWGMLGIAFICGLVLSLSSGWLTMVFAAIGGLIAYFYVAPPLQFGYRGKGYGEIGILFAFGILPVMGSFYVQTSEVDVRALLASLPIGLMTTLILFNHHFLHWQSDKQAGKRTLVVVWGEKGALRFSAGLLAAAMLALVVAVVAGGLPIYSLAAIVAAIPLIRAYRGLGDTNPSTAYLPLMKAALSGAVWCGAIESAALIVQGLIS